LREPAGESWIAHFEVRFAPARGVMAQVAQLEVCFAPGVLRRCAKVRCGRRGEFVVHLSKAARGCGAVTSGQPYFDIWTPFPRDNNYRRTGSLEFGKSAEFRAFMER
jgi:hypothetical protein